MLASQTSGRVLEIGSFTGYATACFLEGAAIAGELGERKETGIGGREGGPFVLSLERDRRALGIASAHIKAMSELGLDEDAAEEASKLADGPIVDFEGDSVSFTYKGIAGCEFLRVNDALATVEEMASSQSQLAPFDIAFVDADKTRLMDYVDALASNDRLLKKGGLIIVDNVLWKGLVLDANNNGYDSSDETSPTGSNEEKALLKKNRRARKLAMKMHQFNSEVVRDERVEVEEMREDTVSDGVGDDKIPIKIESVIPQERSSHPTAALTSINMRACCLRSNEQDRCASINQHKRSKNSCNVLFHQL
eukprot:scaffold39379_cov175-Skeletonema_marinoi.AAC.2